MIKFSVASRFLFTISNKKLLEVDKFRFGLQTFFLQDELRTTEFIFSAGILLKCVARRGRIPCYNNKLGSIYLNCLLLFIYWTLIQYNLADLNILSFCQNKFELLLAYHCGHWKCRCIPKYKTRTKCKTYRVLTYSTYS